MITPEQLDILKDIFQAEYDEWLLSHLTIHSMGNRNFVIQVDHANWQDCDELFPGEYSKDQDDHRP